jgi:hypothetical protein
MGAAYEAQSRSRAGLVGCSYLKESSLNAFPKDLAKVVSERWDRLVGGEYVVPQAPSLRLLRELLEVIYLTAGQAEENRYPQFNVVATPIDADTVKLGAIWKFTDSRPLTISELHRLAPAVDLKKSAILMQWDESRWHIAGLVDLGTSWYRARMGLQYEFHFPPCLFIQVERAGNLRVYQGQYLVAALVDGQLERHKEIEIELSLGRVASNSIKRLWREIPFPKEEEPRDYDSFLYVAAWNVFAALANCISQEKHGGAIIIVPAENHINATQIVTKYKQSSTMLQSAFIEYMKTRNRYIDFIIRMEERNEASVSRDQIDIVELELVRRHEQLIETIRFVAGLSGCDGAIVMSEDFCVLGFGAEIRSDLKSETEIREMKDALRRTTKSLNVEQFGQRHRSAIKLVSCEEQYSVLVISQDGPIRVVGSEKKGVVNVRKGANLVNANMVMA